MLSIADVVVRFDSNGIWCVNYGDDPLPSFTITQTYTGYTPIDPNLIGEGLSHSKLLNLDGYRLRVSDIVSSGDATYKEVEDVLKSGDYDRILLNHGYYDYITTTGTSNNFIFELFGSDKVVYWMSGDTSETIVDRFVPYYSAPKNLRLRSSSDGSEKIFEITVDDNGTLTATECNKYSNEQFVSVPNCVGSAYSVDTDGVRKQYIIRVYRCAHFYCS